MTDAERLADIRRLVELHTWGEGVGGVALVGRVGQWRDRLAGKIVAG
jgi:hypothetical protein